MRQGKEGREGWRRGGRGSKGIEGKGRESGRDRGKGGGRKEGREENRSHTLRESNIRPENTPERFRGPRGELTNPKHGRCTGGDHKPSSPSPHGPVSTHKKRMMAPRK